MLDQVTSRTAPEQGSGNGLSEKAAHQALCCCCSCPPYPSAQDPEIKALGWSGKGRENQSQILLLRSSQASGRKPFTGGAAKAGSAASQEGTVWGGAREQCQEDALGRGSWQKLGERTRFRG